MGKICRQIFRNELGFTLIELMIVVVIIGILATIAIPAYSNATQESKISKAKADLRTLESAIEIYYIEKGEYPKEEKLEDSLSSYIKTLPKDPWTNSYYIYELNEDGTRYEMYLPANETNKLEKDLYSFGFKP
ncbi:MAG: type IV pilin protein [Zhaonellaceae bacterium]|jgi:general secretion pathway protein G|nr:prepilin-type N-terminal cleavage/methylation domain-containing protein [Clostridia bacterium]